jgi:putative membrane protein
MRVIYCLILLVIITAVAVFAVQNNEDVTLHYLDRHVSSSLPVLIGVVYLLGMVSGWTVVGFLKRSLQRVTERRAD